MWNDTDIPLAYLINFRSYGTWLHGDERGSVDRFHNQYNSPFLPPDRKRLEHNLRQLSSEIVTLNAKQRESIEDAIRETCIFRKWILRAINVRTNHVHAVVSIGAARAERALNDFKAYATRRMRRNACWHSERSPWADKGSRRPLWNERSVELAVDYVMNRQGGDLPDFD
ncbi:MAG: transposase [Acidobacteriota bacterium]|nr:transposase [Acidobacteriota bacterium]